MDSFVSGDKVVIELAGRIDSTNADITEAMITNAIRSFDGKEPLFDASALEYISSGGLRALMRVRKAAGERLTVSGASPFVYEQFEMTGFTELFNVTAAKWCMI
ncbi:MAG: STAS domain-containing protein [Oscillospiraceae bacterium]|nr:STAS domain-containing protein [Oscillospiraceae bacterium]